MPSLRPLLLVTAVTALAVVAWAVASHDAASERNGRPSAAPDPADVSARSGRFDAGAGPGLTPGATPPAPAQVTPDAQDAAQAAASAAAGPAAWREALVADGMRRLRDQLAALARARKAGDTKGWLRAASDLGMLGLQMRSAHPPFLDRLREEAVPALLWGLAQADDKLVEETSRWLSTMGARAALQPLLDAWAGADAGLRAGIALALGEQGEAARIALPQIRAAAQDRDPRLRRRALEALAQLGVAVDHVPLAQAALDDDHPKVRENALLLLEAAGEEARHLKADLLSLLQDEDEDVRAAAGSALARLHPDLAVEVALERMGHAEAVYREQAVWMLGGLREKAEQAVPDLVRALGDDAEGVRKAAAWALGAIGVGARDAGPALVALVEEKAPVGYAAVLSLGRIDADAYFDVLSRVAREHPQGRVRFGALHAMNPKNPATRALIVSALQDPDAMVRSEMLKRIVVWGHDGARAIAGALDHSNPAFQNLMIAALARMGRMAEPALPALRRLAEDARSGGAAKTAIRQIERALGR